MIHLPKNYTNRVEVGCCGASRQKQGVRGGQESNSPVTFVSKESEAPMAFIP